MPVWLTDWKNVNPVAEGLRSYNTFTYLVAWRQYGTQRKINGFATAPCGTLALIETAIVKITTLQCMRSLLGTRLSGGYSLPIHMAYLHVNSPYARRGLGRQRLPKDPFFATGCGRSPHPVAKRRVIGGPGTLWVSLQTSQFDITCVR